jgi:hypothetical protein
LGSQQATNHNQYHKNTEAVITKFNFAPQLLVELADKCIQGTYCKGSFISHSAWPLPGNSSCD